MSMMSGSFKNQPNWYNNRKNYIKSLSRNENMSNVDLKNHLSGTAHSYDFVIGNSRNSMFEKPTEKIDVI